MSPLEAAILGLVQGLTEFLPVSSSGHLVLFQEWLGAQTEGIVFEVVVHAATLVAVVLFYRRRILSLVSGALARDPAAWRFGGKLALATLPAVGAALTLEPFFESLYEDPRPVGLALIVTGGLVWSTRFTGLHARSEEPTWTAALVIGLAQAVAIVPGISRSGATVAAGLALGVAPVAAAEFSFLMSVVAITGAVVLKLPDLGSAAGAETAPLAIGAAMALVSGLAALVLFLRLLRSFTFHRFAFYLWPVGAAVLVWGMLGAGR